MRTRFAPSPTGYLHVGGARTAVLNWLVARHAGGRFVLRVEDTDTERNVTGAEAQILDELRWLGLEWDEGPDVGGGHGPYRQSERAGIYHAHAERLLAGGRAYWCTCPPAPADAAPGRRRCGCAERPAAAAPGGAAASVRFRVPAGGEVVVDDAVRGSVAFPRESIEDFVLLRSDGRPTYNFAAVVDDALMAITHVIRGADHLVNTPKQLLLHDAFGWGAPRFAHIPLILGPDRQKLSKRHGATSVGEHRREGCLPEALVNYLSLLSWSSPTGEEVLPRERLIAEVELARVGASDAIFDRDKLRWLSSRYLEALPLDELVERLRPFIDPARHPLPEAVLPVAVAAVRKRLSVLADIDGALALLREAHTPEQLARRERVLADAGAAAVLAALRRRLAALAGWDEAALHGAIREAGRDAGVRGAALFQPLRVAVTGEEHGPDLARLLVVLGRERVLQLLDSGGKD